MVKYTGVSAGIDSSRFSLYWAVLFMASNPDTQDKVHDEIIRVVGKIQHTLHSFHVTVLETYLFLPQKLQSTFSLIAHFVLLITDLIVLFRT